MSNAIRLCLCATVGLLCGACSTQVSSKKDQSMVWDSLPRILRDLDTSLWVRGTDLSPEVVAVHSRHELVSGMHQPPGAHGYGFCDGVPEAGNYRITSLSIVLRGKTTVIPEKHFRDLYNLHDRDRTTLEFGSYGYHDVVNISGSDGERGYSAVYVFEGGKYLGRRLTTSFAIVDDFLYGPKGVTRLP